MRRTAAALITGILSLSGCFYLGQNTYSDIAATPSTVWSSPEVLTMIMEAGNHNLRDDRTHIKAIVTPYYPSVVKAIGRRAQLLHHWSEDEYRGYVNQLLRESSGLYIDWGDSTEPVYDRSLRLVESPGQVDSLLFLLSLSNLGSGTWDISHIERDIFLVNERDSRIAPFSVVGRRMNVLGGIDETMFVKFNFRSGANHFLDKSNRYFFLIRELGTDIRIELTTATMK